jgi:hypothetical protein
MKDFLCVYFKIQLKGVNRSLKFEPTSRREDKCISSKITDSRRDPICSCTVDTEILLPFAQNRKPEECKLTTYPDLSYSI